MYKAAKLREELAEVAKYHWCRSLEQASAMSAPCLLWGPAFAHSCSQSSAWSLQARRACQIPATHCQLSPEESHTGKEENSLPNKRMHNNLSRTDLSSMEAVWMEGDPIAMAGSDGKGDSIGCYLGPLHSCIFLQLQHWWSLVLCPRNMEQAKNLPKMNCFPRHRLSHLMTCRCSLQSQPFCDTDMQCLYSKGTQILCAERAETVLSYSRNRPHSPFH